MEVRSAGSPAERLPFDQAVDQAIDQAKSQLLEYAKDSFAETVHEMSFPRWPPWLRREKAHGSDLFARATLGNLLLDCAEMLPADDAYGTELHRIARREADYLAGSKLSHRHGGWSYFPSLPELPPDLDSLATVISLFARIAPIHLPLCQESLELALAGLRADGGIGTWLISPKDSWSARRRMRHGAKSLWGNVIDPDVCANFYTALWVLDAKRYATQIQQGCEFLLSQQRIDGDWPASWYWGRAYPIVLVTGLLERIDQGRQARRRATRHLVDRQRADGGWGGWQTTFPLETAHVVWVLARTDDAQFQRHVSQGVACLLDTQNLKGGWRASPWIQMDTGRARTRPGALLTYQSRSVTTAFCLRALLQAQLLRSET